MSGGRDFLFIAARAGTRKKKGGSPEDARHEEVSMSNVRRMPTEDNLTAWMLRAESEIFTVTALVTPEMAVRILASNDSNRPLRLKGQRGVEGLAAAMARDEWLLNGAAIIVASDGSLNDGQHRLNAVIKSGASVLMQITFGVDRDSRHTVDQGRARSPGNILSMFGEKNADKLAHALQFIWAFEGGLSFNYRPSSEQLLETLDASPAIRDCVREVNSLCKEFKVSHGYLAGAHYVCCGCGDAGVSAGNFLNVVSTGLGIRSQNDPAMKLRKRFTDHVANRENIPAIEQAALYIKAFNAHLHNRNVRNLSWRRYGFAAEDFPKAG